MNHNLITSKMLTFLTDIETSFIIRDKEFDKFRQLALTATPYLEVKWGLWM